MQGLINAKKYMGDKMEKKISVIVTIYNTPEKYLTKCIESILNQTFKEIEIILVNDGSDKKTSEICKQYKDKKIKLIEQENMGESVARNVGIENATTENITFVDSDDWIEPNMCEKIYDYIQKIKEYDVIIFNCYVDYNTKSIKNNFYPKNGLLDEQDIEEIQLQNIEKGITKYYPPETNISVPWAKVYNKKFIQENGLKFIPNIIRMPDALFNTEVFEKAKKIFMFDEYLYHYQKNDFAICQRYSEDTIRYYETYINLIDEYIKKYNKEQKFVDTLNIKIVTSIDRYMYNYFFHKDNPKNKKEIEAEFKELLQKELYQKAFKNVKKEYLSKYQKFVLKNAQKDKIKILKLLKIIKENIKMIKRKI